MGILGEGAELLWKTTLMAEYGGELMAPQSGLTNVQTEVSETFHCGLLRLFLLGAVSLGGVFCI